MRSNIQSYPNNRHGKVFTSRGQQVRCACGTAVLNAGIASLPLDSLVSRPFLPPAIAVHFASDQKLEVGKAWEGSYYWRRLPERHKAWRPTVSRCPPEVFGPRNQVYKSACSYYLSSFDVVFTLLASTESQVLASLPERWTQSTVCLVNLSLLQASTWDETRLA